MSKKYPVPPSHVWKFPDHVRRWLFDPERVDEHLLDGTMLYCAVTYGSVIINPKHRPTVCRLCNHGVGHAGPGTDRGQAASG